jgi:hypothetical protein
MLTAVGGSGEQKVVVDLMFRFVEGTVDEMQFVRCRFAEVAV